MVEHGVSLARAHYAFNSTNAEGWGLYSEYIMQPYEPLEGQLMTLQLRLLRAARAFLDPELQSGAITPGQAYAVLEKRCSRSSCPRPADHRIAAKGAAQRSGRAGSLL
jgi:uncharacterized protein (DUF885 family)